MLNSITRLWHKPEITTSNFYLISGLGNPGREYRENRHNVGFMVVDKFAGDLDIPMGRVQNKAFIGQGSLGEKRILLVKPQTYMNLSAQSVVPLLKYYKVPLNNLLVIYDDLDLPFGTLRMRPGGGSAGAKGVASIIDRLGSQDFPRLRVGIGRPHGSRPPSDYVLDNFSRSELAFLPEVLERAAQATRVFIEDGLDAAMNRFNGPLDKE